MAEMRVAGCGWSQRGLIRYTFAITSFILAKEKMLANNAAVFDRVSRWRELFLYVIYARARTCIHYALAAHYKHFEILYVNK